MSNEAFHLLSRGGVTFQRTGSQNLLFQNTKRQKPRKVEEEEARDVGQIPPELDYFKYALGGPSKRKPVDDAQQRVEKRRRLDANDSGDDSIDIPDQKGSAVSHRVSAKGRNIPPHADTFEAMKSHGLPHRIVSNLEAFGYKRPTSVQAYCVPILLEGRDLVAISPTGTGKTLAYLLPLFSELGAPASSSTIETGVGVRALIIVPTRELAHQIHNECLKIAQGRKWKIVLLSKATVNSLAQKDARDKVDIIISTPLRLVAALQEGVLNLNNVRHLILDEADRLLDAEFLSQSQEIIAACAYTHVQKALFSATLPAGAEKLAMEVVHDPIRIVVGLKDTPLPLISQSLTYVADDSSKLPSLLTYLAKPYDPPVLIFTSTQARATSLAEELVLNGVPNVDCLHAGLTQKEREEAASRMRKGESWVMVTTEVMGRGMDFKGIREVINYDFPTSVQSYVHRIGRTGRAGREGKAVTFFTDEDAPYLKMIANVILQSGSTVPDWILKLPKPSKLKRKQMGKVKRPNVVNPARYVGRRDAIKRREMIMGSKRRKGKVEGTIE